MLDAINYSEARKNLASLMDSVCEDRDVVVVTRRKAPSVVIMSLDDYNSIQETAYLLRSPANAQRLLDSLSEYQNGQVTAHTLSPTNGEDAGQT